MKYPTLEEVKKADKVQLGKWLRFLPSAGTDLKYSDLNFEKEREQQSVVMQTIFDTFHKDMGGWEPWLSKQIGWEE